MGKIKILVFGNLLVDGDSLPLKLLPKLRARFSEIEFKELDAAESLESEGRDLIILDSAQGIEKVERIKDFEKIQTSRIYSMHDFDLGLTLKLLKKMKKIDSIRIIAVPTRHSYRKALTEVTKIIKNLIVDSDIMTTKKTKKAPSGKKERIVGVLYKTESL